MTALVTWGVLLLVALPAVRRRARSWLVAATALLVLLVGLTRLALGVHFVSDVLAGWALGAAWLTVTTAAFRGWQHDLGRRTGEPSNPLDVAPVAVLDVAGGADPGTRRGPAAVVLLPVAVVLLAAFSAAGMLVTGPLADSRLGQLDRSIGTWLVEQRSRQLTTAMDALGSLGGHPGGDRRRPGRGRAGRGRHRRLAAGGVRRRHPGRRGGPVLDHLAHHRPPAPSVPDLTSGLPVAASWPSGHAAAATAVYGAVAAVVVAYGRHGRRWVVVGLPLLVAPLVGLSRVYVAAHHPTDVVAGLLLGGIWVVVCAHLLLPRAVPRSRSGADELTAPADVTAARARSRAGTRTPTRARRGTCAAG
jgi:undecaprenyl-diphosphatase